MSPPAFIGEVSSRSSPQPARVGCRPGVAALRAAGRGPYRSSASLRARRALLMVQQAREAVLRGGPVPGVVRRRRLRLAEDSRRMGPTARAEARTPRSARGRGAGPSAARHPRCCRRTRTPAGSSGPGIRSGRLRKSATRASFPSTTRISSGGRSWDRGRAVAGTLPPLRTRPCRLHRAHYGEAGASNTWRDRYSLPAVVSGHTNYHYWGAGANSRSTR